MEGKRPATTRIEAYMLLISIATFCISGLTDEEMPLPVFLAIFVSMIVTALFMVSRKRYSWIVTLLYYVFMILLSLYYMEHLGTFVFFLLFGTNIALAFMAFSENERLVHKIFL